MTTKEAAIKMTSNKTVEEIFIRAEAEKMMNCKFEKMTPAQRVLAAQMISAFYNK